MLSCVSERFVLLEARAITDKSARYKNSKEVEGGIMLKLFVSSSASHFFPLRSHSKLAVFAKRKMRRGKVNNVRHSLSRRIYILNHAEDCRRVPEIELQ